MDLVAEDVYAIFCDSLALDSEVAPAVKVRGLSNQYLLNTVRLNSHLDSIRIFLGKLPTLFYENRGGGHSLAHLSTRRDNVQWGDIHDADRLLVLGLALGLVEFCLDRDRWHLFPQGLPYLRINGELFQHWAIFRRRPTFFDPADIVCLNLDPDDHPPTSGIHESEWYRPSLTKVSELATTFTNVAEAFYNQVIVEGFFSESLPSWILDPDTTLQVY